MFETVQQLLRSRMGDDTLAVAYGDQTWTWREHLAEAASEASALIDLADTGRPLHVGALLGNSPAMLRSMAAAGLGGYVLCGINTTRRGAGLLSDIRRADCQLLLADSDHLPLLDGLDIDGITVLDVTSQRYLDAVAAAPPLVPWREVEPADTLMMIFTSGTSGDPKAVRFAHVMAILCGASLIGQYDVTADDVMRFWAHTRAVFQNGEDTFAQHRRGLVHDTDFASFKRGFGWGLQAPQVRLSWERHRTMYDEGYVDFVDRLVSEAPLALAAPDLLERWQAEMAEAIVLASPSPPATEPRPRRGSRAAEQTPSTGSKRR